MPSQPSNDIEIYCETQGPDEGRPLVLMRGLGTQLIEWDPRFRQMLVDGGHRLIVFDTRDVGLSTHLSHIKLRTGANGGPQAPYRLSDMALDVVGLMDGLEIETAHIAGISMGGMIAQELAIRHPDRLRSLISVMSSTGEPGLPGPTPEAQKALTRRAPAEREAYIAHTLANGRIFTGTGFPFDETRLADVAGRCFDRAYDPAGIGRQFLAVTASGSRHEALAEVRLPSLVIHGDADPLIPLASGEATADAIPNARLEIIPGMGHDLPQGAWPILAQLISDHTAKVEASAN
jgi:pimeloyl-ACP methyl ester carboxylesterase